MRTSSQIRRDEQNPLTPRSSTTVNQNPSRNFADPQQPRSIPDIDIASLGRPQTSYSVLEESNRHYRHASGGPSLGDRHRQSAAQHYRSDQCPVSGDLVLDARLELKPGTLIWTCLFEESYDTTGESIVVVLPKGRQETRRVHCKFRPFVIIYNNATTFVALPCFTHHGRGSSFLVNSGEQFEEIPLRLCNDPFDTLQSSRSSSLSVASLDDYSFVNSHDGNTDFDSVVQVIDLDTSYRPLHPLSAVHYTHPVTLHYSTNAGARIWGHISDASLELLRQRITDRIYGLV